jgi:hypothetical protein
MGAIADAYQASRVEAGIAGPGDANKQPNIGESRTGHFNDGIQTAVAANDAAPVGPPDPIGNPYSDAKNLFPASIQRNAAYQKAASDAKGVRPVRRYDSFAGPSTRPLGY